MNLASHRKLVTLLRQAALVFGAFSTLVCPAGAAGELRLSVYATAGDIQRHLASEAGREKVDAVLKRLRASGIFLEGRRGDEYVSPDTLRALRDYFAARGYRVSGAIATVPGKTFGVRQEGQLGWLNYEAPQTQRDLIRFFEENAAVFDEIIVDDFYCTADTSAASEKARAGRSWAQYRQDLLVSLIDPMIVKPSRSKRPDVRLILKFPQWYDLFHRFGYDVARMPAYFDRIWVGTEVRNPLTRRMGFVQPYEGYVNYRWLAAAADGKVEGAWFDHIECTARNFVDQAYQSVLAGAHELTLFRLGDVMEGHPGHELLINAWDELVGLSRTVRQASPRGVAYYKPAGSEAAGNMYLMDYLGMIGLPVVPVASYPDDAAAAILGLQAAADPRLREKIKASLDRGATLTVTPALVRQAGAWLAALAGVSISREEVVTEATAIDTGGARPPRVRAGLARPVEVDGGLKASAEVTLMSAQTASGSLPWLTRRTVGRGRVQVWNVRTFTEADFQRIQEVLLAPKELGLRELPREVVDPLRSALLEGLGVELSAPAGVGFYWFQNTACFYNFLDQSASLNLNKEGIALEANALLCRPSASTSGAASR